MREGTHVPANTHTHAPANTHTRTQCITLESVAEIQLTFSWGGGGRSNINGSGMTRVLDDVKQAKPTGVTRMTRNTVCQVSCLT